MCSYKCQLKPKIKTNSNADSGTPAQIHRCKIQICTHKTRFDIDTKIDTNTDKISYRNKYIRLIEATHCLTEAAVKRARLNVDLFVPGICIFKLNPKLIKTLTLSGY